MYDVKWIRENPELLDSMLVKRNMEPASEKILKLDEEVRQNKTLIQTLYAARKQKAKSLELLKDNKRSSSYISLYKDAEHIRQKIAKLEADDKSQIELDYIIERLPNILAENVPGGNSEKDNVEIRKWGEIREFDFPIKSHYEISKSHNKIEFDLAVNMSGSRFTILKNEIALLERGLVNFMLDIHVREFSYIEYSVPFLVLEEAMYNTGQLPKFSDDSFKVADKYRLIPTGEVPLVNLIKNQIIEHEKLPLRFVTYSPCFRSEAGSAGRDSKGLIRLHQFSKVELVSIIQPELSSMEHEYITNNAEEILKRLELPYRVMMLCSADTGFTSTKTYDIEVWFPSQEQYREISSCSNCGDFQSRRLKSKFKASDGEKYYPHTLNGSALPIGRTIAAILENHQNQDGSVNIPEALRPYIRGSEKINI